MRGLGKILLGAVLGIAAVEISRNKTVKKATGRVVDSVKSTAAKKFDKWFPGDEIVNVEEKSPEKVEVDSNTSTSQPGHQEHSHDHQEHQPEHQHYQGGC